MKAGRRFLGILALIALEALLTGPAGAFVKPQGGQGGYEIPLKEFDLFNYRSALTDADRAETESG